MKRIIFLGIVVLPVVGLVFFIRALHSFANPLQANNSYEFSVNSTIDAVDISIGDGICETGAGNNICTLRAAIQEANALTGTNIIHLPSGIYTLTIVGNDDIAAEGDLDITDSLSIIGESNSTTSIDGNGIDRVFDIRSISNKEVLLEKLTIQNGISSESGGGICNCIADSKLVLNQSIVRNSSANGSGYGGIGGGILNRGIMTITNSTIRSNSAEVNGGGVFNLGFDAEILIERSLINQNRGNPAYGGFVNLQGQAYIINSTISENDEGGLLAYNGGTTYVTNSTIINNEYETMFGAAVSSPDGDLVLANTIISGEPKESNCYGTIGSLGNNLENGESCRLDSSGDIANTNPLLGSLRWNGGDTETYALLPGSPAIDSGSDLNCTKTDQRGGQRPKNLHCDIGAFEYSAGPIAVADRVNNPDKVPVLIDVLANDLPSTNGIPLLESVEPASHGTVVISGTALLYTPTINFEGKDIFYYSISDGVLTDTTNVTVIVGAEIEYRVYLPLIVKPYKN